MKDRTKSILEVGLLDHIRTGEPITSENLYRIYDFGIKPAMIRWELNDLGEMGFFSQAHSSGGRLPTNKAYRFLVNKLLEDDEIITQRFFDGVSDLLENFMRGKRNLFVNGLAKHLKVLSVGYEPEINQLYESGLPELFGNLTLETKSELMEVVKDIELLPKRLEEIENAWEKESIWPKVFIGENPLTKSENLSLIADRLNFNGDNFVLIAIGPKRMDYQKSLNVFKGLKKKHGKK